MSADTPLGQPTTYPGSYDPTLLLGIPRQEGRARLGLTGELPFGGVDVWNAYELSWLDARGKPVVATAELWIPATSPHLVESKSLKLYLNSLNGERHAGADDVAARIRTDVQAAIGAELELRLALAADAGDAPAARIGVAAGTCIDDTDVEITTYAVDAELLAGSADPACEIEETLHSHLLKSNCPVTGQPDWATVSVHYRGGRIDHAAMLRYIVSFRDHDEFHEQCVERMFVDIRRQCAPAALSVHARYTRRGGLDINPFRSDFETLGQSTRVWRQ